MNIARYRAGLFLLLAIGASPSCGGGSSGYRDYAYEFCHDCPKSPFLGTIADTSAYVGAFVLCGGTNDYQVSATSTFTPPVAFSEVVVPTDDLCDPDTFLNGGAVLAGGLLPATPYWFRVVGPDGQMTPPLTFTTSSAPVPARTSSASTATDGIEFGLVQLTPDSPDELERLRSRIGLGAHHLVALDGVSAAPDLFTRAPVRWRSWSAPADQPASKHLLAQLDTDRSQGVVRTFLDVSRVADEDLASLVRLLRAELDDPGLRRVVLVVSGAPLWLPTVHAVEPSERLGARDDVPVRITVPRESQGWVTVRLDPTGDVMTVTTQRVAVDGSTRRSIDVSTASARPKR